MPDEIKPGADAPTPPAPNTPGTTPASGDEWKMEELPAALQEYIKGLRTEAKTTRLEKDAAEKARKEAEQAQLVEQGNWKKLAEDRATELAKLTPYQQRAEALEKIINENNEQMIKQIPEADRGLVPTLSPDALNAWLVKALPRLARKPAPDTDAGAGQGGSGGASTLTDEEKQMAAMMGISPDAFIKSKNAK